MNQQTQQPSPIQKCPKRPLLIVVIIVATSLIVGTSVYVWQKISRQETNNELQNQINDLENQIRQLQSSILGQSEQTAKQMGYIQKVYAQNQKEYLDIDYIQYLSNDEAIRAIIEDGECPADIYPDPAYCIPDGYYIRNQNPQIRTLEISPDVSIKIADEKFQSSTWDKKVNYQEFKMIFNQPTPAQKDLIVEIPFNIEISNNIITKIEQQYIP